MKPISFQVFKLVKFDMDEACQEIPNAGSVCFRKSLGFGELIYFWFIAGVVL